MKTFQENYELQDELLEQTDTVKKKIEEYNALRQELAVIHTREKNLEQRCEKLLEKVLRGFLPG